LAACRAVICASLWPDPADENCPDSFVVTAKAEMLAWTAHERQALLGVESRPRFEAARRNHAAFDDPVELRKALLDFIADFANWDSSTVREYLDTSRALTQAAHEALGGAPGTRPLVVDPFAGGGTLPLEAQRLGLKSFASDLNPVSVLINKALIEIPPKFSNLPPCNPLSKKGQIFTGSWSGAQGLADDVNYYGNLLRNEAEKRISYLYPSIQITPEMAREVDRLESATAGQEAALRRE
jgi:adenine-specific DNA methylase